jgi:hypothetical protein
MQIPAMTAETARQLAASLGLPLYTTDLYMPRYVSGVVGRWRLVPGGFSLDHGYHSGPCATLGMPLLLRDRDGDGRTWDTWMSLSPHEIESQEFGCRHAFGHTVVMGLGMGWAAVNIALNPAVTRVTVIERDPEVIDLFERSGVLQGLPDDVSARIRIVPADALEWRPDAPVDFLYADIWRTLEEPQTLDDVRRMQANVGAAAIYFWGQELFIHTLGDRIDLPLLVPPGLDYPALIARIVAQRRQRWPHGIPDAALRRPATP